MDGDRGALQAFLGAAAYVVGKPTEHHEHDIGPRLAKLILLAQDRVAERRKAKLVPITAGTSAGTSAGKGSGSGSDPGDSVA